MTTAFTLLYAVIGVPIRRLTDRWNRKKPFARRHGLEVS
jgi:predicted MFS family arabinose efflux permease